MEQLQELSYLVTDKRRVHNTAKGKRYDKAIKKLRETQKVSDADLAQYMGMNAREDRYKMFKARLKKRLLKAILDAQLPARVITAYNKAYIDCSTKQYSVRFLVLLGRRKLAMPLAKEGLAKAQSFEFTEFVYYFSRALRTNASTTGDLREFIQYQAMAEKALQVLQAEDQANTLSELIQAGHMNNTVWPTKLVKSVESFCEIVTGLREKHDSYALATSYYRLRGSLYYAQQNFRDALENWIEFEEYINKRRRHDNTARIGETLMHQLNCRIHLLQYEPAHELSERCKTIIAKSSINWFTCMEMTFLLGMFTKEYNKARDVYYEAISDKNFSKLADINVERWEIFGAYVALLQKIIPGLGQSGNGYKKKIKTMLGNTTAQGKDKHGYNVSILVIQFLWSLYEGRYGELTDRIDALRVYANRYLKSAEYKRSYIFLTMIQRAERAGFDYEQTRAVTAKYQQQLRSLAETDAQKKIDGMEVVPYPDLWEMVLALLRSSKAVNSYQ